MKEGKENEGYSIKQMDRPKDKVVTKHGLFSIVKYDPLKGDLRPTCYDCFYKNRKVGGAPCVEGKWCGDLYSSLLPLRLNEEGRKLRDSELVKTATKIAAR